LCLALAACAGCRGAGADRAAAAVQPDQPAGVQRVVRELAASLGVEPAELQVTSREAVTWSSAALGCPEPGKMYAQATTPGWRLTVAGPGDASRRVHATEDGSYWVVCAAGRPGRPGAD